MSDQSEAIEIRLLASGSNWLKVGSMIALGLTGYFSALPEGSSVSVHAMHPGRACMLGPGMVQDGRFHLALTSPTWLAGTAVRGLGTGFCDRPMDLRAIALFPHFDQFAFAVRKDTGITSIRQIAEQRYPLHLSTAPIHLAHPAGWVLDIVLAEYGFSLADIEAWGGSVTHGDRQPNLLEAVPADRMDRVAGMRSGALNAVFDEAMMTLPWKQIADDVDLTFLPVDDDVLAALESRYGVGRAMLPAGSLRGIDRDIPTVDFSGWLLYCRADLPDDLVHLVLSGIEQQAAQIESLFRPYQGLTGPIDMATLGRDTGIDLHPGAARFYRERGFL